jgi:transcriptional regulator with XRE-family HTH domain
MLAKDAVAIRVDSKLRSITLRVKSNYVWVVNTVSVRPADLRVYTSRADAYAGLVRASVGSNIRRLREAAGYETQGAFAKALRVPQSRLSDWENDRYGIPDTPNLLKIATTLRVSIDALLDGVDRAYDHARGDRPGALASLREDPLPPAERQLLELWREITPRARETLLSLLLDLQPKKNRATQKRTA